MESLRRLFWWVLAGSRGGATRLQILNLLREGPANANQIASRLNLNYKTVQHHLRVLEENRMIVSEGGRYNVTYRLSPELLDNMDILESVIKNLSSGREVNRREWGRYG